MKRKEFYCYSCDNEFSIITESKEKIVFCCYCGEKIDEDDCNEEEVLE